MNLPFLVYSGWKRDRKQKLCSISHPYNWEEGVNYDASERLVVSSRPSVRLSCPRPIRVSSILQVLFGRIENFDSESQDYWPIEMICFVLPSLTFKKVNGYVHEPKPNNWSTKKSVVCMPLFLPFIEIYFHRTDNIVLARERKP